MTYKYLEAIIEELRAYFVALYGTRLVQIVLYGSQARGDVAPDSDIDILVVLQGLVNPGEEITRTGPCTASLSLQHNVVISCAFISAERFDTEQNPFLLNVHREGVPV